MSRLWSRFCSSLARVRVAGGAVSASSSCGSAPASRTSSAEPAPSSGAGPGEGASRQGRSTIVRDGAQLGGPPPRPRTFSGVPVATCAGACWPACPAGAGKSSMSEPLVGGAGTASPGPARFGRDRDQEPAMEAPGHEWAAGQHDDPLDGDGALGEPRRPVVASDGSAAGSDGVAVGPDGTVPAADSAVASKVSRRRRRGSRGGRGRHPAPVAVNGSGDIERSRHQDDGRLRGDNWAG